MRLLLFCLFSWVIIPLLAQEGYRIEVAIEGYEEPELYLGFYQGEGQFLEDTTTVNDQGKFVFEGEEPLPGGMYLIVMAPDNDFFQILISENEQQFSINTRKENSAEHITFNNALDNQLFYDYLQFLGAKRPEADSLQQLLQNSTENTQTESLKGQLVQLNESVTRYQQDLVKDHPGTLTSAIIRANMDVPMPEFEGTPEELQMKRWVYTREHYFDNIDLADPRMLRTPFLFERIQSYIEKLNYQHPDSLILAIDNVLEKVRPSEPTFKFYLIHFLNKYATSKIVGMDAVYVHLAEKYYATGQAPWVDEEQLKKIVDNAAELKPLLIGNKAPDITVQNQADESFSLYEVDSKYAILYFWRPDCSHCKKSTPHLKAFYEAYKDKDIKLIAVCTKTYKEVPMCWEYIDEKEIGNWLHAVDPYNRSRYYEKYNVKTTPQIYILDEQKIILAKQIGAEQLGEVMDQIMLREQG